MNKVLIVCLSALTPNGGSQCVNRNIETVTEIFGKDNTYIYKVVNGKAIGFKNLLKRLLYIAKGYYAGLNDGQIQDIYHIIKENKINIVYIDGSFYGILSKIVKCKFPNVKIVTFFHNCEFEYSYRAILANKTYLNFYNIVLTFINERMACQNSDEIIVLNDRDRQAVAKWYKRSAKYVIPITFKSWYEPNTERDASKPLNALFVGSYFYGNTEGLRWFCKSILPKVNIHFTVVGAGMEKLKEEIPLSDKLDIYGKVDDLKEFYEKADLVILPILSGGGMKVKTAESLMFGKYIIGTPEAFTGYEINNSVAKECSTIQEFIDTINSLSIKKKFNHSSRALFESKYSYQNSLNLFRKVFMEF